MLTLNPQLVTFGDQSWPDVTIISVDRTTPREIVEWADTGPHAVFADAPEQRIDITIVMTLTGPSGLDAPRPGQAADLTFITAPTSADAGRTQVTTQAVILAVTHDLAARKATRTIKLVAVSGAANTDPITTTQL